MEIAGGRHDRDDDGEELVLSRPVKRRRTTPISDIIASRSTHLSFHPTKLCRRLLRRFIRPLLFKPPPPPTVSSSSSSEFIPEALPPKHDVFISYSGSDVRYTFLSHLYTYLKDNKKFVVYKDDLDLERGEEISPSLLEAIERSAVYIVIFSPNYANSPWCLDELVRIHECSQRYGRRVIPVFYGGVDPSEVENQRGSYRKLPAGKWINRVRSWRAALTKSATISGFDSRVTRPESKLVEEISIAVLQAVYNQMVPVSYFDKGLVGLERRMNEIEHWATSRGNLTIGLWGMGGIGKTTLAKAIYNRFSGRFEASYFFSNFSNQLSASSRLCAGLQNDFYSELLGEENARRISHELKLHRLARTRALVVVDDVGNDVGDIRHLHDLFHGRYSDLFAPGSIIVLTSRNKQVLKNVCHHVVEVKALDRNEALRLFCLHAFKQHCPPIEYEKFSKRVITYADGNPLALTILGSQLYGRDPDFWDIELNVVQREHCHEIGRAFLRSYDGLSKVERNVFLDIACFYDQPWISFKELERLLDGHYVEHGGSRNLITKLVDKCILSKCLFVPDSLKMHGLLRDLGRSIINDEPRLEKRSRLFEAKDIYSFFKQNKGGKYVEGIVWNTSSFDLRVEEIHMQSDVFAKLENLRYLVICLSEPKLVLPTDCLRCLPDALRILEWDSFPAKCLPCEFYPGNLVSLSLRSSNIEQLWEGAPDLRNLKFLDLYKCIYLKKLPDLSAAQRLEEINLSLCAGLVELPLSMLHVPKLEVLKLKKCTSLELNALIYYTDGNKESDAATIFPKLKSLDLSGTSIRKQKISKGCSETSTINDEEVIHTLDQIFRSNSLVEIWLSDCIRLKELPEILEPMAALTHLHLDSCTSLSRLPDSIVNLVHLEHLSLCHTPIKELPTVIGDLAFLVELRLCRCTSLASLPNTIHKLSKLQNLNLFGCSELSHLPELPSSLTDLNAYDCTSLQALPISSIRKYNFSMARFSFGNCGKLDLDVCRMLFNKFTKDVTGLVIKCSPPPWLLLPTNWGSLDGMQASGSNSVVTATLHRPCQLTGLIYCASFHYNVDDGVISPLSYATLRVECHLSNTKSEMASSCSCFSAFVKDPYSHEHGTGVFIWYDSELGWMRRSQTPVMLLDSSLADDEEIAGVDPAVVKLSFRAKYRDHFKLGENGEVPILIKNCGVIPIYDDKGVAPNNKGR